MKMPFWNSISLQNSNSPSMELLMFFYDLTLILSLMIMLNLMFLFLINIKMKYFSYYFPESQSLEDLWLMIPMVFLFFIGFPSIKNLYMQEDFMESDLSFKVLGHQWYWTYSVTSTNSSFDSMIKKEGFMFRLIESFNHLIIPMKCMIRLMISSQDVIHSWAVPSLGIKMDAVPGRLSQTIIMINRPSLLIGQCSEICGTNHSFMPIIISSNSMNNYM